MSLFASIKTFFFTKRTNTPKMDITVHELKRKMDAGEQFVFLDVREPMEYHQFNLGAKLIPLGQIPNAIAELEAHKNDEIVIHCHIGGRSRVAQELLLRAGFKKVVNVTGGASAWVNAFGKEIEGRK